MSKSQRLTQEPKINYTRMAMALCGVSGAGDRVCETFIRCYEGIIKKKGNFSINDSSDIECAIERKYNKKEIVAQRDYNKLLEEIAADIRAMKQSGDKL